MFLCRKIFLIQVIVIITRYQCVSEMQASFRSPVVNFELLLNICKNSIKASKSPLLHIVNLHPNFPIVSLIQQLHKSSISTVLIDRHIAIDRCVTKSRAKNVMFILKDRREVLSLILDHSAKKKTATSEESDEKYTEKFENNLPSRLPNYCVNFESSTSLTSFALKNGNLSCDYNVSVSENELESNADLSDLLFNHTSGLVGDRIFNGVSNLIFLVQENFSNLDSKILSKATNFDSIFKFIWRVFRGFRTIVCISGQVCYRYNPFTGNIVNFVIGGSNELFYFTLSNMNGKTFLLSVEEPGVSFSHPVLYNKVMLLILSHKITSDFVEFFNGSLSIMPVLKGAISVGTETLFLPYQSLAQRFGVDFTMSLDGMRVIGSNDYDFSPAIDTGSLCFITPRRGFVPQYFVPLKSFPPSVWAMIFLTYATCLFAHYLFSYTALNAFCSFLTEKEIRVVHENYSSNWSVYCYFFCIQQPRLILGHLICGKLLFSAIVFTTMTLLSIFQSEMMTLVTKRVRYPDLKTIEELEKSELQIQSNDLTADRKLFESDAGMHTWHFINRKLTNSHKYLNSLLEEKSDANEIWFDEELKLWRMSNTSQQNSVKFLEQSSHYLDVLNYIQQNDAFLVFFPIKLGQKLKKSILDRSTNLNDYQCVEECVMSYPSSFSYLKYSPFADSFNNFFQKLIEGGLMKKDLEDAINNAYYRAYRDLEAKDDSLSDWRPFSLVDLSSGFLGLACGVLVACLVFVTELLCFLITDKINSEIKVFENIVRIMRIYRRKVRMFLEII